VYDRRAKHKQDLATASTCRLHLTGNIADHQRFGPLGTYRILHEGENIFIVPGALKRVDANALMAHDDLIADLDTRHWYTEGLLFSSLDDDCHIHLDPLDRYPHAVDAHIGG